MISEEKHKEVKKGEVVSRKVAAIVRCPACSEEFYLEQPGFLEGIFGVKKQ
jgi:hypothetical protein